LGLNLGAKNCVVEKVRVTNTGAPYYESGTVAFIHRDYDPLWETIKNSAPELFKAWRDCGFLDESGKPRTPSRSGTNGSPVPGGDRL
jgi:hypothetical protein